MKFEIYINKRKSPKIITCYSQNEFISKVKDFLTYCTGVREYKGNRMTKDYMLIFNCFYISDDNQFGDYIDDFIIYKNKTLTF